MAASAPPQSIGLFGGTFDPVHTGHLALAAHVLDRCRLDRLLFIPAPEPPHKRRPEASFAHRTAMLEVALADCPHGARMALSLIEADLPAPSYTIRTVEALMAHCRQRLSSYKVPHVVHQVSEIPRTGSGKIIRFRLKEMVAPE